MVVGKTVAASFRESLHFAPNWTDMTEKDRPEVDRVDHVLYSKLGGDFDYDRSSSFTSLASIRYGLSSVYGRLEADEPDRDLEEAILMLNILTFLDGYNGDALIDDELPEYPMPLWVSPSVLSNSWETKDISDLIPSSSGLTEVELCIHGVCIDSSVKDFQLGIQEAHLEALNQSSGSRSEGADQ